MDLPGILLVVPYFNKPEKRTHGRSATANNVAVEDTIERRIVVRNHDPHGQSCAAEEEKQPEFEGATTISVARKRSI